MLDSRPARPAGGWKPSGYEVEAPAGAADGVISPLGGLRFVASVLRRLAGWHGRCGYVNLTLSSYLVLDGHFGNHPA